ncbi:MAG TPA: ABC transporter permease [Tepidisphaeraceae bacterium]|jgi:peptide/nickel transport system permease protein|nr:ABC transporter permease [Tepidisphaeraceae bacterium]
MSAAPEHAGISQPPPPVPPRSIGREAWRRLLGNRLSLMSLIIVAIYVAVGLFSFTPYVAARIDQPYSADKTYAPPSFWRTLDNGSKTIAPERWFGLDFEGRSVFWRLLYGTRLALLIMVCTCAISISIGAVLGLFAGYFGGWVDDLITWLYSTVSSIPWLLLVIAMAYVIQNMQTLNAGTTQSRIAQFFGGSSTVILALGLTDWVGLCRLIRGEVIKLRDLDFVVAARALGLRQPRILFRHVLPNTFHIILITFSLSSVAYIQAETILAFLGLGITSKPSWGRMIDDSKLELLRGVWWELTAATVAILILSLALNVLGDAMRDALDPKLHGVK